MGKIHAPDEPRLLDKEIFKIQTIVSAALPWLDNCFGRALRSVRQIEGGKNYLFPAYYLKSGKYTDLSPDQKNLLNYSFWIAEDPQEVDNIAGGIRVNSRISVIFWFNAEKVASGYNTEAIKEEILEALGRTTFKPVKVYERAENVFRGFSINEKSQQFMMWPFFGFRFEGNLNFIELC